MQRTLGRLCARAVPPPSPRPPTTPTAVVRPVQQRLFTGALFPEGVNEELCAFAVRHRAHSNVWVPLQCVEDSLKPFGVYVLPSAALCDIALTTGGNTQDYTELSSVLSDRILVNADHTSNPRLLETFRDFVVAVPRPDEEVTRGHRRHGPHTPSALDMSRVARQPLQFPRFRHPLTTDGTPILHRGRRARLVEEQANKQYHSNYWFRVSEKGKHTSYHNAEETSRPGLFNPSWCVRYKPYTITGQLFPKSIARLMRQRAVDCGYVSRLWLTRASAERCFNARLAPERVADAPPVHTTFFTGGLQCCTYYCADQFVCPSVTGGVDAPLCAPRLRDIELAAKGVAISPEKLRAFPLLSQLVQPSVASLPKPPHADSHMAPASGDGDHRARWSRRGADTALSDGDRHRRFVQATARYARIQLLGDRYLHDHARATQKLEASGLQTALQQQCVLRGFATPFFVSSRCLCDYALDLVSDEEGFIQEAPVQLNGTLAHLDGECWFNVSQLQEPEVALRLFLCRPMHFLCRTLIPKAQALLCVRLQKRLARGQDGCCEWIPQSILSQTGWCLRPGAYGVPNIANETPVAAPRGTREQLAWEVGAWYSMNDVMLPDKAKEWLRTYSPVSRHGELFLRGLRMVMTLRAYERGYQSPLWVCLEEEDGRAAHDGSAPWTARLRTVAAAPLDGRALAADGALASPPFVLWSELHWVNAEELVEPPPSPMAPTNASSPTTTATGAGAVGKGVSAEVHTLWRMRRFEQVAGTEDGHQ